MQELKAEERVQKPGVRTWWPEPHRAPVPAPGPGPPWAPLTLDLLMHYQGEVVHLQDVRELAQWVHQADLEEMPGQQQQGHTAWPQPGWSLRHPAR